MPTVQLKHINKVYDNNVQAVFDFNLDIKDREFIVFVGPSGCGKSTTLRMIAGLEEITDGELFIDGVYSNDTLPKNRDIAMVFQNYALYPHMSVYDNMAFGLKNRHIPKDEIDARVKAAADILGIREYLDRKPKALSGGQCQRVALGRAIVRHAKVFLMDEPLSNLDAKLRVQMRSQIIKIHERIGAITIYVTHDQTEAMTMADRIVVMNRGHIQQIGSPREIYNHPANLFVAGFIGDPPMNFIRGKVDNGVFASDDGYYSVALPQPSLQGKGIVIGYRPEHAHLALPEGSDPADYLEMKGKIEVYEMLGDLQNVYLAVGEEKAIIKVAPEVELEIGNDLIYYVKKADFHFFDAETEEAIEE